MSSPLLSDAVGGVAVVVEGSGGGRSASCETSGAGGEGGETVASAMVGLEEGEEVVLSILIEIHGILD